MASTKDQLAKYAERRRSDAVDVKAITSRQPWMESTVRPYDTHQGRRQNNGAHELLARDSAYVNVCAWKIASAVASVPMKLFVDARRVRVPASSTRGLDRRTAGWMRSRDPMHCPNRKAVEYADAAGDNAKQVLDHPVLRLLERPNPFTNGFDYFALQEVFLTMTGTAYDLPIVDRDGVAELWPLYPQWVNIIPSDDELIGGYWYGRDQTIAQEFAADEVLYRRQPSPVDPYYGKGQLAACISPVDRWNALERQQLRRSLRDARPDYAVQLGTDQFPTQEQVDQVRQQIHRLNQQGDGESGVLVLGGKAVLTPLMFPPKDLGNVEEQKAARDVILHVMGVPESLITVEDVNLANGKTGHPQFMQYTILPRLQRRADFYTEMLLPMFGFRRGEAWFSFDDPVPEDRQFVLTSTTTSTQSGLMTVNEARAALGLEKIEDPMADRLLFNGMPLGQSIDPFAGMVIQDADDDDAEQPGSDTQEPASAPRLSPEMIREGAALLTHIADGVLAADAAVVLLVGLGFSKDQARSMADAQESIKPEPVAEQPDEQPAGEQDAGDDGRNDDDADQGSGGAADQDGRRQLAGTVGEGGISQSLMWRRWDTSGCECGCEDGHDAKAVDPRFNRKPVRGFARALGGFYDAKAEAVSKAVANAAPFAKAGPGDFLSSLGIDARSFDEMLKAASASYIEKGTDQGLRDGLRVLKERMGDDAPTIDLDIVIQNENIRRVLETNTARFVKSVNDTDEEIIRQIIADGIEAGLSNENIAKNLRESFAEFSKAKADIIARTESARANTLGELATYRESGVVTRKKWLLAPGACEFCRAVAAEINEAPLDEPFLKKGTTIRGTQGGTMNLDYEDVDAPPLHPNDRCAVAPVIGD